MISEINKLHELYKKKVFSWIQVEDCVEGSDAIKRKNELYLPMPSGYDFLGGVPADTVRTNQQSRIGLENLDAEAPFNHSNKNINLIFSVQDSLML